MKYKVSIIIVNYNGAKVLLDCLNSVFKQKYKHFEIIVVDNNSTDHSIKLLEAYREKINLIILKENKGFTGGNIEGLKHAGGDYIVLLNNDTEVTSEWLGNLIAPMEQHPEIGICASKMVKYGTNSIDSAGDGCTTTARGFKIGENESADNYTESKFVFGACGGAVAYRRKMIEEIGFLDDDFFLIHEDTDLNFRAQLAGWKCYFVHDAIVYHKVRSTIGEMSDIAVYYSIRNAEYVRIKNLPSLLVVKYFHHYILQEIGTLLYFCIKHRKWKMYLKAKLDVLKSFPMLLSKRKKNQKKRKVASKYIDSMLTKVLNPKILRMKLRKLFTS
ncbi:glycosyltransferase family 2 protein [Clostridium formicaceticum]|uniref:Poly-beta-1,6-N-acetyl-D-glucosamine synthase n=1 Tax=Clostridium formicaceticum TaxID=1497 RepID=A0AAC9WFF7_9CLOT|nr:glycosyltransferase family 2 protein [Clostridium formicaceticum]AOY75536.1 hypothetical protein BJL90_06275 [Clostridium formicaceticum]ARE85830.1 Poly-beta-1,6-N-acetyl-D-glucosamine synthase [Clostridium formicaceticum]